MKASIYLIFSKDPNITSKYIGCTNDFDKRIISHKHCCENINTIQYTYKLYEYIRLNGGFNNWSSVILESFEYQNNIEKHQKENDYFKQFQPTLNSNTPGRNQKDSYSQYYQKNRLYLKAKMMERYFKRKSEKLKIK